MQQTINLKLNKFELTDEADITLINPNWDSIDTEITDMKKKMADTSYVDTKVAELVGSAPGTLDTLNELAQALGNDPAFATTVATQIGTKVDKVDGKGLSTNDYTTAEKNKLAGIATNANNYVHPSTHLASIIVQDTNNRFVTDTEKSTWNGKANASHTHNYAGSSSAGGSATSALACTGNSATATKLQTARTINGVSFDGTSNITIADSTKLPLSGGTLSGNLVIENTAPNLTIKNTTGAEASITLDRSGSAGWKMVDVSGNLKFQCDWTTAKGEFYDAMVLNYNSGNMAVKGTVQATSFDSTVASGTAPLTVKSTTVVSNLNADMLDGLHSTTFARKDTSNTFLKEQQFCSSGSWVDPAVGSVCAIKASGSIVASDEIKSNTKVSSGNCSMQYNSTTESLDFIFV